MYSMPVSLATAFRGRLAHRFALGFFLQIRNQFESIPAPAPIGRGVCGMIDQESRGEKYGTPLFDKTNPIVCCEVST